MSNPFPELGPPNPVVYNENASGRVSVDRGPGLPAMPIAGAPQTGYARLARESAQIAPDRTYHERSVLNPAGWLGHNNLRVGAWAHRGAQRVGLAPGAVDSNGESRPLWRMIRTSGVIASLAVGATLAAESVTNRLPQNVQDIVRDQWESNGNTLIGAGIALGAVALARAMPNGWRDAMAGRRGDPLRPNFAVGWFGRAWGELRNTSKTWGQRTGGAARAAAVGAAANAAGIPLAPFRGLIRR